MRPTALASGDFDGDGVPDLICGYAGSSGSMLTMHRGNVDSIFPHSAAARARRAAGTFVDQPFLTPPAVLETPTRPDFIGVGDLDNDGYLDAVVGARDGRILHLMAGDGAGGLRATKAVELPGSLTAMTTGEINRRDGLADLIVGVRGPAGPQLLVFEDPEGALRNSPEVLQVSTAPTELLLARLADGPWIDLVAAAGDELLIVRGRDRRLVVGQEHRTDVEPPVVERIALPSRIESIAWGDFAWEPIASRELAVLLDDGTVRLLDGRGETIGRREGVTSQNPSPESSPSLLLPVRLSGAPTDDLALVDRRDDRLLVLAGMARQDSVSQHDASSSDEGIIVAKDLAGSPIAALPMRLNRDALTDFVLLQANSGTPVLAETALLATITVNTAVDIVMTGDGCSLREAINNSNSNSDTTGGDCADGSGADSIEFDIGGGGAPAAIAPTSALPMITDAVTIDGSTQGCANPPCIVLDGNGAGPVVAGLRLAAGSSTVRGLVIQRFTGNPGDPNVNGDGIHVASSSNIVEGNFIGTNVAGTLGQGNDGSGVVIDDGSDNTIGGAVPGAGNVLSAAVNGAGLVIPAGSSQDNQVLGNRIGTDVTGTIDLGNGASGIVVDAANNTIGGTTAGARNIISGNEGNGVFVPGGQGNLVLGNFIGTDANGTAALANGLDAPAVSLRDANNTVGGTAAGARNLISGNASRGVQIAGVSATGNEVLGNLIGTDVNGTTDVGNTGSGVWIRNDASDNIVGGTTDGARNIVSGNDLDGILISQSSGNQVLGNFVGIDVTGTVALGNGIVGIEIDAGGSNNTIGGTSAGAGNLISGNAEGGVFIEEGTGNTVSGNLIGTDVSGTTAIGNGDFPGVLIWAPDNTVGGLMPGAGNVISGNESGGIILSGIAAAGNQVLGNYIGTDASGTVALGNGTAGIRLENAPGNTLGGTDIGARNIIAANGTDGVSIVGTESQGNDVLGNYIGTDMSGAVSLGNGFAGVRLDNAPGNTIGGTSAEARNIISGNGTDGVGIFGASSQGNLVLGNFIGTDLTGTVAVGNLLAGLEIELGSNNTVGGISEGAGNVISGNGDVQGWGVVLQAASGNEIVGNLIGLARDGITPLGNRLAGVGMADGSSDNTIGGLGVTPGRCDGPCNRIGFTTQALNDAVRLFAGSGSGNAILGNSILSSAELGIDLEGGGVTPNDPDDPDAGANDIQNFPVLSLAEATPAGVTVDGSLDSTPDRPFRVEFFSNASCDASGHGEGAVFLGFTDVVTDPAGDASFSAVLPAGVSDGDAVTATATNVTNSTSEFSACIEATCLEFAIFGETILAADESSIVWTSAADVRFAKGNLADLESYIVSASGDLFDAASLDISQDAPDSGEGMYYVVRPLNCGSWQTVPGAEPGRDAELP